MKILLVEDSASLRLTLANYIKHSGFQSVEAESGEQAIDIVQQEDVDLIIMDVEMPGLNGFETTQRLRQIMGDRWVPIIFLTGITSDESYAEGIDAGGDDYLTKPISQVILNAKLRAFGRICDMQNQLARLNHELQLLSSYDSLTELFNRRAFEEYASRQWEICSRNKEPLALLMIDVDMFKPYNDHYGHQQGDECLKLVAKALDGALSRPGDVVARYGGEEFVAILPSTDVDGATNVAETLCAAVEALQITHEKSDAFGVVTASIGGVSAPKLASITLETLIEEADKLLYESKHNGRNRQSVEQIEMPKTVLVADDNEDTLRLVEAQLEGLYHVASTNSGEDCIDIAHNTHPDIILLDIHMPDMSGIDVCRALKLNPRTAPIPVIFISGEDRQTQLALGKDVKANGCLEKPLDQIAVIEKVQSFIG
ncbi:response regulator [Aurantivibrio plasticivorans]